MYWPQLPNVQRVISPNFDFDLARRQYRGSSHGVVVVDGFLSDEALQALLRFAMEATVWFDLKRGYLGAYMSSGWANDVLVKLVEELRQGLPDIIGNLPLQQMW